MLATPFWWSAEAKSHHFSGRNWTPRLACRPALHHFGLTSESLGSSALCQNERHLRNCYHPRRLRRADLPLKGEPIAARLARHFPAVDNLDKSGLLELRDLSREAGRRDAVTLSGSTRENELSLSSRLGEHASIQVLRASRCASYV